MYSDEDMKRALDRIGALESLSERLLDAISESAAKIEELMGDVDVLNNHRTVTFESAKRFKDRPVIKGFSPK